VELITTQAAAGDQGQEATAVEEQLTVLREQQTQGVVLVQRHNEQMAVMVVQVS
jgi:hypothetical protein